MTAEQRLIIVGIYVASALYIVLVFAAGFLTAHPVSWKRAVATAGACYVSYFVQLLCAQFWFCCLLVSISIALGAAAGLSLLW
jgi:hypothetical protein